MTECTCIQNGSAGKITSDMGIKQMLTLALDQVWHGMLRQMLKVLPRHLFPGFRTSAEPWARVI